MDNRIARDIGVCAAVGVGVGALFGQLLFDNAALGAGVGIALGVGIGGVLRAGRRPDVGGPASPPGKADPQPPMEVERPPRQTTEVEMPPRPDAVP
jgi:hypothetical protein